MVMLIIASNTCNYGIKQNLVGIYIGCHFGGGN